MIKLKNDWFTDILFLALGIGIFYGLWLGSHPLLVQDEARYSEVAREMIALHDYITPHLNGTVLLDKPVLFYWLQVSAFKLFGLNEWAARLWPALLGLCGCLMTYVTARNLYDRRSGIVAAIILATSPLYFCMSHYANLDIEVAFFISAALLIFILICRGERRSPAENISNKTHGRPPVAPTMYFAYIFIALAFLAKGLIGFVLPTLIVGVWILVLNRWQILLKMRLVTGLLLALVIAAPWYWLMQQHNPDFFNYFFYNQQFTRYLSQDFNNAHPVWFYVPVILLGLLPWIFYLPQMLIKNICAVWQAKQAHATELFLLLWPLLIFIFFTLPHSKTIGYITPVLPPLAILLGRYISDRWQSLAKWFYSITVVSALILLSLVIIIQHVQLSTVKPIVEVSRNMIKPADRVVIYEHFFYDLPFYLQRTVDVVTDWSDPSIPIKDDWEHELRNGSKEKSATIKLLYPHDFVRLWNSKQRVFAFTNDRNLARLKNAAGKRYFLIRQEGSVFLVSNRE
jgi:4-amino-4-deoxy-L-arabinose transferase-like glycosyltransferase